jgi:hypothetical protein
MSDRKRPPIFIWVLPPIVGFGGFVHFMQSPRYELYRAVDVVQLLGCGACFGAAMVGVIFMLRGR